ncbi:hypothetical protein DEVEQU_02824 [Devosia equisanguinis]|uniref:Uncharacterized protein n=1 Tax=Devosia equisanguinis TaxID=2490941 RepID=A0A3S4GLG6_9HYPH|nr:hypothetical protein DEVEQU_02824 [Devosia equisanguinis]
MGAKLAGAAQNHADGAGAASGQAQRAGIGTIAQLRGGSGDAAARGLVDFGIAVERTADRGLRQAQMFGEIFQSHFGMWP